MKNKKTILKGEGFSPVSEQQVIGRSKRLKSLREIITNKDIKDIKGWSISKGTKLFVMNDSMPTHPTDGYKLILVRVDNGTGHLDLCPETCIKDTDLK